MARLTEAALKRLEEAQARYSDLSTELSDPATFGDARRAADLGREQSDLGSVVELYERYTALIDQLGQAEDLLRDGADDELQALAREEVEGIEPLVDEVVNGLQDFLRPRD